MWHLGTFTYDQMTSSHIDLVKKALERDLNIIFELGNGYIDIDTSQFISEYTLYANYNKYNNLVTISSVPVISINQVVLNPFLDYVDPAGRLQKNQCLYKLFNQEILYSKTFEVSNISNPGSLPDKLPPTTEERDKESEEQRTDFENELGKKNREGIVDFEGIPEWKVDNGDGTFTYTWRERDINGEWKIRTATKGTTIKDGKLVNVDETDGFMDIDGIHYADSSEYLENIDKRVKGYSDGLKGMTAEFVTNEGLQAGKILGAGLLFEKGGEFFTQDQIKNTGILDEVNKIYQGVKDAYVEVEPSLGQKIGAAIAIGAKYFVPFIAISKPLGTADEMSEFTGLKGDIWDFTEKVKKGDYKSVDEKVVSEEVRKKDLEDYKKAIEKALKESLKD
ncbi:MAG: hypothetical protein JXM74_07205, partial [Fusobacteriaceae bacterium]|nr:hypothetical protein [Fusobacteriaceae bacterium]